MQVRKATAGDLEEILGHNNTAVPAVNALDHPDLEHFLEVAHSFLVIDGPDDTIAGFMIGLGPGVEYDSLNYAWFSARYEEFIYVDRVVVAEQGRGLGVGTRLYDEFAARGRADGHEVMLAEVNIVPRNDVSLSFHDARGFVSVGEQDTEGGAKRVTLLEKRLDDRPRIILGVDVPDGPVGS
jgi:predicted GNAT superfamily acetyltransferase